MQTRRAWLGLVAAGALARPARAALPQVVVVGGGPAGITAARTLQAAGGIAVTLIERNPDYRPPWTFNAALGGLAPPQQAGYAALRDAGITVLHAEAEALDLEGRRLRLQGGTVLAWDRLVLAPGIALRPGIPGGAATPHAWTSEAGLAALEARVQAVPQGGTVVITLPEGLMRCPTAPYERASMLAHRLRRTGRGGAHVMVLDAKETGALLGLFQAGWEQHQPGMVEWLPPSIHGGIERIEPGAVVAGLDTIKADLVCAIPPQGAGAIATSLADGSGWCPVDPLSMASRAAPGIHVAGDAAAFGTVPKSAVAAAASGRIAALGVLASLGREVAAAVMENLCWARLAPLDAIRSADLYRAGAAGFLAQQSSVSPANEAPAARAAAFAAAGQWEREFMAALFG